MSKKQNILIAGATGLIGKACVKFFQEKGYGIIVLTQRKDKAKAIFKNKAQAISWKELNEKERVHPPIDIVINLAGANIAAKRWTKSYKQILIESRSRSTEALVYFVKNLKTAPKHWIQASAIGYYGYEHHKPEGENAVFGNGFLAHLVKQWENSLVNVNLPNIKVSILRLGLVINNKGGLLPQLMQTSTFKFIACPGKGDNILSWIHISDLLSIMNHVIEKELSGVYNTTSPFPIQMDKVCTILKKHTKSWLIIKVTASMLHLILGKEKANELALASQNSLPNKLLNTGFQFQYPLFENCLQF